MASIKEILFLKQEQVLDCCEDMSSLNKRSKRYKELEAKADSLRAEIRDIQKDQFVIKYNAGIHPPAI